MQRLRANKEIEKELDEFESKLRQTWRTYQERLSLSNLTIEQWKLAKRLLRSDSHIVHIVVEADKILGRCIKDSETYKYHSRHLGILGQQRSLPKTD